MSVENQLADGLHAIGCELSAEQQSRLIDFISLMNKWSRVYNLTAVRKKVDMVSRHLLDSLVTLPYLKGSRVLDVGSGAGLPGLPLAIARPDLEFVLIDSSSKKTRFMLQAVGELALSNVRIEHCRIEDFKPDALFDTVITRAFADTEKFLKLAGRMCIKDGQFLLMQGESASTAVPEGFELKGKIKLSVPGSISERYLTIITPVVL